MRGHKMLSSIIINKIHSYDKVMINYWLNVNTDINFISKINNKYSVKVHDIIKGCTSANIMTTYCTCLILNRVYNSVLTECNIEYGYLGYDDTQDLHFFYFKSKCIVCDTQYNRGLLDFNYDNLNNKYSNIGASFTLEKSSDGIQINFYAQHSIDIHLINDDLTNMMWSNIFTAVTELPIICYVNAECN